MPDFLSVHIAVPSRPEADKIARALVEEKLGACVSVLPAVRSVYRWEGKVEEADEVLLIVKTRAELFEPLRKFVKTLHSHSCPCIVGLPIVTGHPAYLDWLGQENNQIRHRMPANELPLQDYLRHAAKLIEDAVAYIPPQNMERAIAACVTALKSEKPILVCGNGGSAADAMHITGELVARFLKERKALRCICLSDNPATLTAWSNDYDYASVFARQVEAYGCEGAVLLAITTSGRSPNLIQAAQKAKEMNMQVIGLTGQQGGKLAPYCDILLDAPGKNSPEVQQIHACLYHYLCEMVEARMAA